MAGKKMAMMPNIMKHKRAANRKPVNSNSYQPISLTYLGYILYNALMYVLKLPTSYHCEIYLGLEGEYCESQSDPSTGTHSYQYLKQLHQAGIVKIFEK